MRYTVTRMVWMLVLLLMAATLVLSACKTGNAPAVGGLDNGPQLSLADAEQVAETFLAAWETGDFATMYTLISPNSREAYIESAFIAEYQNAALEITLNSLETQITNSLRQGATAAILYDVVFQAEMFGAIEDRDRTMRLIETPEGWRVAWSRMDIFAELAEGARLHREQTLPNRGNIYDRNGQVLVDQNGRSIGLYLVKQDIRNYDGCVDLLSRLLRREYIEIEEKFIGWANETLFFIGEIDAETYQREEANLINLCDIGDDPVDTLPRNTRRYFGELAAHIIGYIGPLTPEQAAEYKRRGYPANALIGQSGIEATYEQYLAGKPGGVLMITSPTGGALRVIARTDPEPGQSVYLSIDRDLQEAVQNAFIEAYNVATPTWTQTSRGAAAVVMDVRTGEILAAVSYPSYDPSLFNPDSLLTNEARGAALQALNADPRAPLLNRVTQALLPAGSVFKIVSTAAGLDSGVYTPDTSLMCTGKWYGQEWGDGLPFRTDWNPDGHGLVNFPLALTYSCDPYFWQLGANMHQVDPQMLTQYAYEMGLGVPTGQNDLPEEIGQIPNEQLVFLADAREWNIADTLDMVIGQGKTLITPLQIVRMVAAAANGGQLLKPIFVNRVQLIGEAPVYEAEPEVIATLDYAPWIFELIQDAMCDVTLDPLGTARYMYEDWYEFQQRNGFSVVVCGKTGTAQTGGEFTKPEAWFVAFAPQDDPEIAIAVVVENSCEGSEVAAPIVRRIIEDYYGMPHGEWPGLWRTGCYDLGE